VFLIFEFEKYNVLRLKTHEVIKVPENENRKGNHDKNAHHRTKLPSNRLV
jgi:hypothetical protein